LEVPFRSNRNNDARELKRSYQSDADFSVSSAGDGLSVGGLSLHSIADLEHAAKLMAEGGFPNGCDSDKEEYDESDPFATWSAPEDRAKQDSKQMNWFQRAINNQHKSDGDSDEVSADPFDTCSKSADPVQHIFSDDTVEASQQERRGGGFQLFRGLRGNRGQK
jgi:hypothetical protein